MIFITGDTHSDITRFSSKKFPQGKDLTEKDFVIVLGDFGMFWKNVPTKKEEYWLKWLSEKPWTTLFLDGNHENFSIIDKFQEIEMFGGKVGYVNEKLLHLKRGEIYTIDGIKFFVFGGGFSIDKAQRIEDISWWAREAPNFMEYKKGLINLTVHNDEVDFILTHDAPTSIYKAMDDKYSLVKTADHDLPKFLEVVKEQTTFKHWFFGHFHFNETFSEDFSCLYGSIVGLEK